MSEPERKHFDNCSCPKPAGCWGDGGVHIAVFDKVSFVINEIRAAESIAGGKLSPERHAQVVRAAESMAPLYVGTQYVYETCPAYRAARERANAERKRGDAAQPMRRRRIVG